MNEEEDKGRITVINREDSPEVRAELNPDSADLDKRNGIED